MTDRFDGKPLCTLHTAFLPNNSRKRGNHASSVLIDAPANTQTTSVSLLVEIPVFQFKFTMQSCWRSSPPLAITPSLLLSMCPATSGPLTFRSAGSISSPQWSWVAKLGMGWVHSELRAWCTPFLKALTI